MSANQSETLNGYRSVDDVRAAALAFVEALAPTNRRMLARNLENVVRACDALEAIDWALQRCYPGAPR